MVNLLSDAWIMTVYNCKKGYRYQQLDEASSFLTTFNTELGKVQIHSDAIWCDSGRRCFSMQAGPVFWSYQECDCNSWWHNDSWQEAQSQWLCSSSKILLDIARSCSVWLNYEKLQYKKDKVDFFGETYTTSGCKCCVMFFWYKIKILGIMCELCKALLNSSYKQPKFNLHIFITSLHLCRGMHR